MAGNMVLDQAEPGRWRKVLIVGGPGSGKTTLAIRLADALNTSSYELDAIGYEGGAGAERSLEDRERDVSALASLQDWVAEGSFIGWTDLLAEAADGIVWLDVPWSVARHRIVFRHIRASLTRSNRHPGWRKLWRFVQDSRRYYTGQRPEDGRVQTANWLKSFTGKILICRTNLDVEQLLHSAEVRQPR